MQILYNVCIVEANIKTFAIIIYIFRNRTGFKYRGEAY